MSTTTVRLDDDEEKILDKLAAEFGGRSSTVRRAIRLLAADVERRDALRSFLQEWNEGTGPVDEQAVAAMADRYGL